MTSNKEWMKEQIMEKMREKIREAEKEWDKYMEKEVGSDLGRVSFKRYQMLQGEVYYLARHLCEI